MAMESSTTVSPSRGRVESSKVSPVLFRSGGSGLVIRSLFRSGGVPGVTIAGDRVAPGGTRSWHDTWLSPTFRRGTYGDCWPVLSIQGLKDEYTTLASSTSSAAGVSARHPGFSGRGGQDVGQAGVRVCHQR